MQELDPMVKVIPVNNLPVVLQTTEVQYCLVGQVAYKVIKPTDSTSGNRKLKRKVSGVRVNTIAGKQVTAIQGGSTPSQKGPHPSSLRS